MWFDVEKYKEIKENNAENPQSEITWLVSELGKKVDDLNYMASTNLRLKNAIQTIASMLGVECGNKFDDQYYMEQIAQKVLEWREYRTLVERFHKGKIFPDSVSVSAMNELLTRYEWEVDKEFISHEYIRYKKLFGGKKFTIVIKKDSNYLFSLAVNKLSRLEEIPIMKLQFTLAEIYQNELGRTPEETD